MNDLQPRNADAPIAGVMCKGASVQVLIASTLAATASIAEAVALMAIEGVDRLQIVGPRGVVVGTVTALDLVRWLAHQDGFPLQPKRRRDNQSSALARRERMVRAISAALDGEVSFQSRSGARDRDLGS